MATIVTRAAKGSPLTNNEVDTNFTNLNTELGTKANTSSLATVATTGAYSDLTGKPTNVSSFTNDSAYITSAALTTYQPLDGDLTAIAALAGTTGFVKKTAANTYALDTSSYLTGITSGDVTTALGFTPYNATNPSGFTSNIGTVTSVNLTAGTGVSVSGGPITASGAITVTNTAPDQVVALTGAGATVVTGTYPNFTITSPTSGAGTVTSVDVSGGSTGLTTSGGPVTSSGTITLAGTLGVANGGMGATTLTSGYLLKGNGTSAVSASVVYDTGTNVGIGTVSPASKLDVVTGVVGQIFTFRGAGTASGFASGVLAGANALELTTAGTGGVQATRMIFRGSADAADIEFYRGARGSETLSMFIEGDNGNVGLGTITPSANLEAFGVDASIITHHSGQSRGGIAALSGARIALTTTSSNDDLVFGYAASPITSASFVPRMTIDNGSGIITAATAFNAPVFNDSVNSAYYVDPASGTVLNRLVSITGAGNNNGGNLQLGDKDVNTAKWSVMTGGHYSGTSEPKGVMLIGSYSASGVNQVSIGGNVYEANPATQIVFYTATTATHATGGTSRLSIDGNGVVTASVDLRAPIFYDSNNTAYYVDPASTSRLANTLIGGNEALIYESTTNALGIRTGATGAYKYFNFDANGNLFASNGSVRAPIFYDSDNTARYLDPASTSVVNTVEAYYGNGFRSFVAGSASIASSIYFADAGNTRAWNWQLDENNRAALWGYNGSGWSKTLGVSFNGAGVFLRNSSGTDILAFSASTFGYSSAYRTLILGDQASTTVCIGVDPVGNPSGSFTGTGSGVEVMFKNGAYFISPNSANNSYNNYLRLIDGYVQFTNSARAPIFYDSDNTGYYFDGAGTTSANIVNIIGGLGVSDSNNDPYGKVAVTRATGSNFTYYGLTRSGQMVYGMGIDTSNNYWIGNSTAGADGVRSGTPYLSLNTSGQITASGDFRAPIFYDSNNAAYYIDPNEISRTHRMGANYFETNNDVSVDTPFGLYFNGGLSQSYGIFRESGAWSHPYPDLRIAFHTGIKMGALAGYGGMRFYTNSDMATQVMSINNSADGVGGGHVFVNDVLQAGGSLRAPIFYDSNNTVYYIDAASGSVMNSLILAGDFTVGNGAVASNIFMADSDEGTRRIHCNSNRIGFLNQADGWGSFCADEGNWQSEYSVRAPIFYDSNNTARYFDGVSGLNMTTGTSSRVTVYTDDSGLHVANGEGAGGDVRIGAAYNRVGIYNNPSLHLQSETSIEFWTGNTQRGYFDNASNLFANSSMRSQLFYDSNDTGYYINPNGDSNLSKTFTYLGGRDVNANWNTGFQNTPPQAYNFHGDISSGGPAGTWWFYESMRHSNSNGYWGTQVAWGWEDNERRLLQRNVQNGTFSAWVEYLNTSGRQYSGNLTMTGSIISSASDVRAPIFYDQNDTSAYVDPAGASWIKGGFQMMNPSASNDCFGGLELRENGLVAASQSSASYAPRVNFHWGSRAAATIYMDSGGQFVFGGQSDITNNRRSIFCADLYATGNVTAYYSDDRLKTRIGNIENALDIVSSLNGFRYVDNELAETFGYANNGTQLGVSAQEVQKHLPEIVRGAAFDVDHDDPDHGSKTGENYLTVDYSRMVPLLIEAIKELRHEVEMLKK
jgi:hypothetical protein